VELHTDYSLSVSLRDVTDFGNQVENILSVKDQYTESAIGNGCMLKNQSHTRKADVHCCSRFGKSDSILTYPVHNDGNWKRETLIAPLNCIALITHKPSNRQFRLLVLGDGFPEGGEGQALTGVRSFLELPCYFCRAGWIQPLTCRPLT
jgi:hypothetical protein